MFRIGLLGCGRIGRVHAEGIARAPRLNLACVFDPVSENASDLAGKYGAQVAASAQELIESPDIDAIVIATPTHTHGEMMLAAAQAGKPMYGEKPVALDFHNAVTATHTLEAAGAIIMTGFNRRYQADMARMKVAVDEGRVGAIRTIQMTSRGPNLHPRHAFLLESGGFYRDKGVHFYDLARWLTGETPTEVAAMGAVMDGQMYSEADDIDNCLVMLRFPSGALCMVDNARRAAHGFDERYEIFGMNGLVEANVEPSRVAAGESFRLLGEVPGEPRKEYLSHWEIERAHV